MLLILPLIFAYIGYVLFNYHKTRQKLLKIKSHFGGPESHYFLGSMPMFAGKSIPEIFEIVTALHTVHGEDIAMMAAFNELELDLSSSKNVEKVLLAKSIKKSFAYDFLESWLGTGLLISTGEKWFRRRKIITPTFHFKVLENFLDVFNKEADILVAKLERHAGKGEFDIYDYVTLYALDSICETSMGVQVHAQDDPNNEYAIAVKQMSTFFLRRLFSILRSFPSLFFLYPYAREQKKVIMKLHNFTNSVIDSRRKLLEQENSTTKVTFDLDEENMYSKRKMTFLDLLLNVTVDGKPLSREDIREEVDTFMFEGHDTTTSGISFTLWHLAKYQDVQQKLYDEINRVLGTDKTNAKLTNVEIQELEYLDMVVKESLRLIPPVPVIGRTLLEDLEMNGTIVPAGTSIAIKIYNIHRNPKIWPDPEKFDPERFSKSNESSRGRYDYIPFSAGSRNCIGQRYAMMELKVTLIKLLAKYKVLPGESMHKMRFKADLVIRPDVGIPIKLAVREP
ncbi:cytochrome P450 4d1-like [Topomyia yanbarensis]|uniref:cytochrome P450 4d1-like n=1 Tax=Topomyia yanbarensis TaxID=2498891 RepID=UPI00273CAF4C|nr:cytochrome P450 4d1-like [Topomyia yanbarensis]